MSERHHFVPSAARKRGSTRRRKPLVIEGNARRLDEQRPRGMADPGFSSGRYRQRPAATSQTGDGTAETASFFGRRSEPEVNLFTQEKTRARTALEDGVADRPATSPIKIAMVAGAVMAAMFILPSLLGVVTGSGMPSLTTPSTDASLGHGLNVSNIRADILARDGASILTLTGDISNGSSTQAVPPPIEILLTDGEGGRIVRRVDVTRRALRSGESVGFSSSILVPRNDGERFELSVRPVSPSPGPIR